MGQEAEVRRVLVKGPATDEELSILTRQPLRTVRRARQNLERLGHVFEPLRGAYALTPEGLCNAHSRRLWTRDEDDYLRAHFADESTRAIAAELYRTPRQVYCQAHQLGLSKSAEYIESTLRECGRNAAKAGKAHRFQKGHVPANKGLKRPGYARGRMKETQFRKGERRGKAAENWCPVGTIRPDSDGFLRIKVRDAVDGKEPTGFGNMQVWPMYSRYLWEQHHGPIPPKHIVTYVDGDRSNCAIENLKIISMAENALRNQMWNRYPRPLAEAIQLNGVLKRKLREAHG
jgi:hypothetical protein